MTAESKSYFTSPPFDGAGSYFGVFSRTRVSARTFVGFGERTFPPVVPWFSAVLESKRLHHFRRLRHTACRALLQPRSWPLPRRSSGSLLRR